LTKLVGLRDVGWLERHLSFAGNTSALNKWLGVLIEGGFLTEVTNPDNSKEYKKNAAGQIFHDALRNHVHVRIFNEIIRHYSGERLKR
jgi:hypothetical protein